VSSTLAVFQLMEATSVLILSQTLFKLNNCLYCKKWFLRGNRKPAAYELRAGTDDGTEYSKWRKPESARMYTQRVGKENA